MRLHLLTAVVVATTLGGCAGSTKEPASQTQQVKAEHKPGEGWRTRLGQESADEPIEIAGRRFQRYHRTLQNALYYGPTRRYLQAITPFYGLRDADTGKEILPVNYQNIYIIPNVGVFWQTPEDTVEFHENNEGIRRGLRPKTSPEIAARYYQRLNPATNQWEKTDIRYISWDYAGSRSAHIVMRDPIAQDANSVDLYAADFFTPDGKLALALPRLKLQNYHMGWQRNSGFAWVTALSPEGKVLHYLLDDQCAPRYVSETPITKFTGVQINEFGQRPQYGTPDNREFFGIPVPGRPVEDDLWLLLDYQGNFSAPEGAIGFRPISERMGEWRGDAYSWLVLYDKPADPNAARWAWAESKLFEIPEPRYTDVTVVFPPSSKDRNANSLNPENQPFLMLRQNGIWQAARANVPTELPVMGPNGAIKRTSANYDDVHHVVMTELARWPGMRKAREAAWDRYLQEQAALRAANARDAAWRDAVNRRDAYTLANMVHSRPADDWYTYALTVGNPELMEQAAGKVSNPQYAKDLRDKAVKVRKQQEADRIAAQREAEQRLADERAAAAARAKAASSSYGSWSSPNVYTPPAGGPSQQQQMQNYGQQLDAKLNAVTGRPSWSAWNPR